MVTRLSKNQIQLFFAAKLVAGKALSFHSLFILYCLEIFFPFFARSYFLVCDDLESKGNWVSWLTQATSPLAAFVIIIFFFVFI